MNSASCIVCLTPLENCVDWDDNGHLDYYGEQQRIQCFHRFHIKCISKSISTSGLKCPECRTEIDSNDRKAILSREAANENYVNLYIRQAIQKDVKSKESDDIHLIQLAYGENKNLNEEISDIHSMKESNKEKEQFRKDVVKYCNEGQQQCTKYLNENGSQF